MKCNVATKSTVVLTKEETKVKKICEFFDCRKICTYEDFVMALECGEYVIGGTLVPFNPQYVFHYDEGRFDVFEVEPSMKIHPRMKVYRHIITRSALRKLSVYGKERKIFLFQEKLPSELMEIFDSVIIG